MDVAPWMDEMGLDHRVEWGIEQSVYRYRAPLYGANNNKNQPDVRQQRP